jgi:release factor glutamine methyltransferase
MTCEVTLHTALLQGVKILEDGAVPVARLTAEVLLSHAVRHPRTFLYAHPERELKEVEWIHYGRYLHERLSGKPTQYITGRQEFYGREFRVTPAVLIPRPETEHLVETAIGRLQPGARIIDVGCGSGAIAVSVALELHTPVLGCDISLAALAVARRNALALQAPVEFIASDLLAAFAPDSFDAVLSNPPYVPLGQRESLQREVRDFEPKIALFGGSSGNEIYSALFTQAARVLKTGGLLILELGFGSLDAVLAMTQTGWQDVRTSDDLAGIPRVLTAQRK